MPLALANQGNRVLAMANVDGGETAEVRVVALSGTSTEGNSTSMGEASARMLA